jgi:tetratricopeptide (TPR) repeat protein
MMRLLTTFVLVLCAGSAMGHGGGSNSLPPGGAERHQKSPEQMALESYRDGMKLLEDGLSIQQKADQASSEKRQRRGHKKAQKRYRKAMQKFVRAVEHEPMLYQAHVGLARALSHTGDDAGAMRAYDRALALKSGNTEVMALRAISLLRLGQFKDVQSTYALLSRRDRQQAAMLKAEILKWQKTRAEEAFTEPEVTAAQAFDEWVAGQPG